MNNDVKTLLAAAAPLIELAVAEDIGPGDATSLATLDATARAQGRIVAKQPGVIAGLPVVEAVFRRVDPTIAFTTYVSDGQEVTMDELVAVAEGPTRSLLAAERLVLNFLMRMSGIATATRTYTMTVATTSATILDTRKTLPGYRVLDKYAVRMGGGVNHRMSLFDMMMVKDNHVDAAGGIAPAVARARAAYPDLPIEVEVRDLDELRQALAINPPLDRILLDNMDNETMREAVALAAGRVPLEASGTITLARVREIADTGVDYISSGALTHSVKALDLSMKIHPAGEAPEGDVIARIQAAKAALGDRLVILGHHYQRAEIVVLSDIRGDSLELSRQAAQTDADYIVFCGVHFMAESAAILAKPGQHVLIPDMEAGCYLAHTATRALVEEAWATLDAALDGQADAEITPITYVNSDADLKAFCGEHGGLSCTSGNADRVLRWALAQRSRVFFFPDQHLGRNTALKLGIAPEEMLLWHPRRTPSADAIGRAKVILWPGVCNVHQRFRPEQVAAVRAQYPGIRVIVHPECKAEVVRLADDAGSTAYIIKQIEAAPPGTQWAIGTESRLVARLQQEHPEQTIVSLADVPPYCIMMSQITPENLLAVLEGLTRGELINEVTVDPEIARWAKVALERMLAL
ncbi:MAG TPA: quinolinate synthase NadA [Anaerolineae bacterium]|nr:quinolinate synthase NadA [Anaerolineae bacterium]